MIYFPTYLYSRLDLLDSLGYIGYDFLTNEWWGVSRHESVENVLMSKRVKINMTCDPRKLTVPEIRSEINAHHQGSHILGTVEMSLHGVVFDGDDIVPTSALLYERKVWDDRYEGAAWTKGLSIERLPTHRLVERIYHRECDVINLPAAKRPGTAISEFWMDFEDESRGGDMSDPAFSGAEIKYLEMEWYGDMSSDTNHYKIGRRHYVYDASQTSPNSRVQMGVTVMRWSSHNGWRTTGEAEYRIMTDKEPPNELLHGRPNEYLNDIVNWVFDNSY